MVEQVGCPGPGGRGSRVLAFIGRQEWIDRPSYRFEHALSFVFNAFGGARNQVTNVLSGVWLGHPVHPPLASLASGVLAATVALDVLGGAETATGRGGDAHRLATYTLGVGIAANLGAAATGVTDWQHTHERDRRIGLVHGLLNLTATALYGYSWQTRRRGHHLRGAILSTAGYAISGASGYLGGALVFGSGIGTDMSGPRLQTHTWTPVLAEHLLPDGTLCQVQADGLGLVVGRDGQSVTAVSQYCPHLGAPMADGWLDRGRIVCPWHGSQFDTATGQVVRGPAASALPCYQTRINDGYIEVRAQTTQPESTTPAHTAPTQHPGEPPESTTPEDHPNGNRHDTERHAQ
ncbi:MULTISPECIES: Rieske 2Fe-2S domain-containing protein [Mycobacteroides]|uniref:Rieske 2Fe-2S domain-containing protein n=1 Tax=Mycobacteroides TaxID=670516 RepID=UPI000A58E164|nr:MULTISPECIES: Rieske 2Fe-2S domain-containing protein [Mycobacteroides]TDZ97085.1 Cytochrome b6-f complex iron-sulfur subunit [Mycobacteroides salmoniphilum]